MTTRRVLIVHDDSAFIDRMRTELESTGPSTDVLSALSAPRALGMIKNAAPDIVVADADLPGMDGYALCRQIVDDPATAGVPVIIVTSEPDEVSSSKAREAGARGHMTSKGPVDPIVNRIAALLGGMGGVDEPVVAPGPDAAGDSEQADAVAGPAAGTPSASAQVSAVDAVPSASGAAGATAAGASPAPTVAPSAPAGPTLSERELRVESTAPHIDDLLRLMVERGGSDLHVTTGSPPCIRIRGEITPIESFPMLKPKDTMTMLFSLLSEEQRKHFETEMELDFAYSIPGLSRFRANVFQQRNAVGAVFRVIPISIPSVEQLNLPKVCVELAEKPRGLVLVTGPTGSGKSTTLAAMIDHINANDAVHIMTMEDPIEFMHHNKRAIVNQREVGEDTKSFANALKRVLRQDPDVILVGELRDLETISAAITAAETGHLVFATLHTTGGPETVDRIIDVFPPHQQQQVRMQLSSSLEGVLSQVLLRTSDGQSRVMAMEVMLGIPAISNLIREGKTHQMESIIQGGGQLGMQTLDQALKNLVTSGKVTFDAAMAKAKNPRELAEMLGRKA